MTQESSGGMARLWRLAGWLVALAIATGSPAPAAAIDDPALEYRTLTTEHFHVHYYEGLEDLARKTAVHCEEAHEMLVPLLDWRPAGRTHVFVNDRLDTANGSANVFGRNHINIFGMPPESDSVLGYYDDWLRILVYHEYVHILHLDTTTGLSALLNTIIGKQLNPNQLLPRWYIEGIAVYYESARTDTGRVRGSLYQMWLREEALRDEPMTLGATTGRPTRWPFGSTPYLMGGFFIDWIVERHGESFITEFNHLYGSRIIPFSMNQAAQQVSGETFDEMWGLWMTELRAEALALRVSVRARGATELERITDQGTENKFPRIRPGHREVSFYRWTHRDHPTFAVAHQGNTELVDLFEVDGAAGPAAWTPDGEQLVYSRKVVEENIYRYEDLHVWDARTGQTRRLTERERSREPALSPDGDQIVYVRNRAGTMELVLRDFADGGLAGPERLLVSGERWAWDDPRHWQQVATPVFTPSGDGVIFSWWRLDTRQRDLWLYRFDAPEGQRLVPLMRDEAVDLDPHFGPDGMLYFSSDRTGIYNIYAMDLKTRQSWQITDVVSGAFTPRVTPDGQWVYVTTYSSQGYDIARFPRPTRLWERAPMSQRHKTWRRYPEISTRAWTEGPYRPLRWLRPLFFMPNLGVLASGAGFSATVQGNDPLRRHVYNVTAGMTTSPQTPGLRPSVGARYGWRGSAIDVTLNGAHQVYPQNQELFVEDGFRQHLERQTYGQVQLAYPFSSLQDNLQLNLRYRVDHRGYAAEPVVEHEPGDRQPIEPELGWFNELGVGLSYSWLERYPYSVTLERGVSAGISAAVRDEALGSDYESLTIGWAGSAFVPVPWLPRNVLSLSGSGGYITSNFRRRLQYSMGGNTPQNTLQSLVFQGGSSTQVVRGYPPNALRGAKYIVGSGQWRFPIWDLDRGLSTCPCSPAASRAAPLSTPARPTTDTSPTPTSSSAAGGELVFTAVFGYYLSGQLRLGWARGLTGEDATSELYMLYGGGF